MLRNILFTEPQVLRTDRQTRISLEHILFYFLPKYYSWERLWCCYTFPKIDTTVWAL